MKLLLILLAAFIALVFLIWFGLQIKPRPFPPIVGQEHYTDNITVPDSLPSPVKRFYGQIYNSGVPLIESAIIAGRAKLRIKGITFPARFQFFHIAGQSYRHSIELTFWGFPVMKVNEYYTDGRATLNLPFGTIENEPKVNQGANLALWGEAIWYPAIYLSDLRAHWQAVDDEMAILNVPFKENRQQILVRFDPESGLPQFLEAMRYKEAVDKHKTLWIIETNDWKAVNGHAVCNRAAITWFDEGDPWAVFNVEEIAYNLDVEKYTRP